MFLFGACVRLDVDVAQRSRDQTAESRMGRSIEGRCLERWRPGGALRNKNCQVLGDRMMGRGSVRRKGLSHFE